MSEEINFAKDAQTTVDNVDLSKITEIANDLEKKKDYVKSLEEKIKDYKRIIHEIESGTLPTL